MILTGSFLRSLDEKGRFAIPKRIRDALQLSDQATLFLAPGTDGSLTLFTERVFFELGDRLAKSSPTAQNVRTFSRLFYAQAQQVEMDKQGRLRIPAELAELASLNREIMLVGVRDHLEIWDRERWLDYLQRAQPHYDELAEHAFGGDGKEPEPAAPPRQPR